MHYGMWVNGCSWPVGRVEACCGVIFWSVFVRVWPCVIASLSPVSTEDNAVAAFPATKQDQSNPISLSLQRWNNLPGGHHVWGPGDDKPLLKNSYY